jgi:hypothetical protein
MDAVASGGLARRAKTSAAYGEVVWSWRRDPGATLAVSPAGNGGKKGRFPGESTKETVKPLRGESRCELAEPVVTTARALSLPAYEAAGAVSARLSLRPLSERGTTRMQDSGENHVVRILSAV